MPAHPITRAHDASALDAGGGHDVDLHDPHGFEKGHEHGHVIMSVFTLRVVLLVLLFFTALTVGAAQAEHFIADSFGIHIPHWVNVVGVLTIAIIKSILVAGYFMQLKYDNPMNSIIFVVCLFCLVLFLGFTMLDLGFRGTVTEWKAGPVIKGGTGAGMAYKVIPKNEALTGPVTEVARQVAQRKLGEAEYERQAHAAHAGHGHAASHDGSSANRSRPRTGRTTGLFDATAPDSHDDHSGGHDKPGAKDGHGADADHKTGDTGAASKSDAAPKH